MLDAALRATIFCLPIFIKGVEYASSRVAALLEIPPKHFLFFIWRDRVIL